MTDAGRKDMTSKITDTLTPESQKSTGESLKDKASGGADSAASSLQPDSQKSSGQKASDEGGSMLDQAKDTLGMGNKK